jgi:hypothetical protein
MKWEVCEQSLLQSVQLNERSVYKKLSPDYLGNPSPPIGSDNREYTVVPTILLESPKGPRAYEPLNPAL